VNFNGQRDISFITGFFKRRAARKLEKEADEKADDALKQSELLKALNNCKEYLRVVQRFESGKYAINEDSKKEYIKALITLKQFDRVQLQSFLETTGTEKVRVTKSGFLLSCKLK